MDTMPLQISMIVLITNLPNLSSDLNLLPKKLLLENTWEALLQDKFDKLEEVYKKEHNFMLFSIFLLSLSIPSTLPFV